MTLSGFVATVPLAADDNGIIRVGGTRVTLDSVIASFETGACPEEIIQHYPGLELADIYYVVGYYLRHQAEVEAYLQEQARLAAEIRKKIEAHSNPVGLREKLLARRNNQQ